MDDIYLSKRDKYVRWFPAQKLVAPYNTKIRREVITKYNVSSYTNFTHKKRKIKEADDHQNAQLVN